jgi:predicted nucleic acid-binding protein
VLFDTDVLIFAQRGLAPAMAAIVESGQRHISVQTLLEFLQASRGKAEHHLVKSFLREAGFLVLPLTENIGHRAAIYMEEYGSVSGLQAGDAIVAACAVENGLTLISTNARRFRQIKDLPFRELKMGRGADGARLK